MKHATPPLGIDPRHHIDTLDGRIIVENGYGSLNYSDAQQPTANGYKHLAHLTFSGLRLCIDAKCPTQLRRRIREHAANQRIFIGIYPGGIVYADRLREEHGDYKRLAFLCYSTLELSIEKDCPPDLAERIRNDAKSVQSRKGTHFQVSTRGQTIVLGKGLQ